MEKHLEGNVSTKPEGTLKPLEIACVLNRLQNQGRCYLFSPPNWHAYAKQSIWGLSNQGKRCKYVPQDIVGLDTVILCKLVSVFIL